MSHVSPQETHAAAHFKGPDAGAVIMAGADTKEPSKKGHRCSMQHLLLSTPGISLATIASATNHDASCFWVANSLY